MKNLQKFKPGGTKIEVWRRLGGVLGRLGRVLGRLGRLLGALGWLLGRSWDALGTLLARFGGPPRIDFGALRGVRKATSR